MNLNVKYFGSSCFKDIKYCEIFSFETLILIEGNYKKN